MARQVAQPLFFVAALPLESTGASRRAITAFSLRHRAALFAGRFHFLGTAMRQPAPGRRLLLATGRSPGAARVRAFAESTRAGAASDPTRMTPHESAPRWNVPIGLYSVIGLKSRRRTPRSPRARQGEGRVLFPCGAPVPANAGTGMTGERDLLVFRLFAAEQAAKKRRRQRALGRFTRCGRRILGLFHLLGSRLLPRRGLPRSSLLHFHFLLFARRTGTFGSLRLFCLRFLPLLRHDHSPDRFTKTPIPYGPPFGAAVLSRRSRALCQAGERLGHRATGRPVKQFNCVHDGDPSARGKLSDA